MMDEISLSTAMFLNSVMFFGIWFFCNWHIRYTFVVAGYNRKGSYNRKLKKYKNNWPLLQRICLIPLLQESKSTVYKFLFVNDWLQFLMAWLTLIVIFLELSGKVLLFPGAYLYYAYAGVVLIEIAVTLETGRRK